MNAIRLPRVLKCGGLIDYLNKITDFPILDMHSLMKPALSILLCLYFWTDRLPAQELDCDVKITNKEALTAQAREALADFLPQVTQYINSYRWTREDLANQ